jgi:hypothetical protein
VVRNVNTISELPFIDGIPCADNQSSKVSRPPGNESELQLGMLGWFENATRKPKFDIKQTLEQTTMGT